MAGSPPSIPKPIVGAGAGIAAALALIVPFIAQREGHDAHPYKDVVGVLTVCYGHTGKDIVVNHTYSNTECKAMLETDIQAVAQPIIKFSPELKDKPYLLASTISFTYNVGIGAYEHSSVAKDFHDGNYAAGCKDMLKYTFAGGKFVQGLANRRGAEYTICMKGT